MLTTNKVQCKPLPAASGEPVAVPAQPAAASGKPVAVPAQAPAASGKPVAVPARPAAQI